MAPHRESWDINHRVPHGDPNKTPGPATVESRIVFEASLDPIQRGIASRLLSGLVKNENLLQLDRSLLGTSRRSLPTAEWNLRGRRLVFVHNTSPPFCTRFVLQSQRACFFADFKRTESRPNVPDSHIHILDFDLGMCWITILAVRVPPSQVDISNLDGRLLMRTNLCLALRVVAFS